MPAVAGIARVAIRTPLYHLFDYLAPAGGVTPGTRVRVPFGRGETIGLVVETADSSTLERSRLKPVREVLDDRPVLDTILLRLLTWAADYYHQPPGEVFAAALPRLLRAGRQQLATVTAWRLTAEGRRADPDARRKRAPRQAAALDCLAQHTDGADAETIESAMGDGWRPVMRRLESNGLVTRIEQRRPEPVVTGEAGVAGFELSQSQRDAVDAVATRLDEFGAFLLDGVTGSGKTEVYLQLAQRVLAAGKQVLVLVPEIGLTPQLVGRFRRRLDTSIVLLHSGLGDSERLSGWRAAHEGRAGVIVGTRSAVFTPLTQPGLVIVDEEHDTSYKQQEGFRYSARDLAVLRARLHGIPLLLGSATPSLESLHNVDRGRYERLELPARPGAATLPAMELLDMRREPVDGGLSGTLVNAMREHLADGRQVLLFLNRRGFAPAWFCGGCGWIAPCRRCDARMTLHQHAGRLRCHHCGAERQPEADCTECSGEMMPVGMGTERIEETITRLFPGDSIARIDRDSTRRRGSLENLLAEIQRGERRILIGTQMLTKGHHFPDVTLVGIVDADQGLFGTDPRSSERLAQLVIQVAGRAGRADRAGRVLIQTQCPQHPLLNILVRDGYAEFASAALQEREAAGWPPYTALALLRAEAADESLPVKFLERARRLAGQVDEVAILGPVAAPMPRRAGRYRAQLLVQGPRSALRPFLSGWAPQLAEIDGARRVRWSLDIDPVDLF